jgi:ubiquinone/menaquinone biosynthesis C-methylase UbiE
MAAQSTAQEGFNTISASYERSTGGATRIIAKQITSLASPLAPNTHILDNACGTGIVVEELLSNAKNKDVVGSLHITAVDPAPNMINVVKLQISSWGLREDQVDARVLAAEQLDDLPSEAYDVSFTNFGFMFFQNPQKAAGDVFRTLKRGGKGYITTWESLGYLGAVQAAAKMVRPEKDMGIPWKEDWWRAEYLKEILVEAGFDAKKVTVKQEESWYQAEDVDGLVQQLVMIVSGLGKMLGWSEEDIAKMPKALKSHLEAEGKGIVEQRGSGVGVRMVAHVGVCEK